MKKLPNPSGLSLSNGPEAIDNLPPKLRECVYEFGWSVVRAFMDHGIRNPSAIRHLVHTVWTGPKEAANRRPPYDGNHRSLASLDAFLIRSDAKVNARALIGLFRNQNLVLLPREPSPQMVEASGSSANELRDAILTGERQFWPFLDPAR